MQNHLLIISGLAGEESYRQQFTDMSLSLHRAAKKLGVAADNIILLSEQAVGEIAVKHRNSNIHSIREALAEIENRSAPGDRIFVVLIGHGNPRGDSAVFNLPGPDLTAGQLAGLLDSLKERTIVIINSASSSGPFIKALSGDNRIVVTATSSGREYHAPVFGEYFISAFVKPGADRDKDDRISILEAFEYARREVRRSYDSDKRLLIEHALLDDNGDGVGSLDPKVGYSDSKADGVLASRIYLQQAKPVSEGLSGELLELSERKQRIEKSIGELKSRRGNLQRDNYYRQLEVLLIDLALLSREIRARGG